MVNTTTKKVTFSGILCALAIAVLAISIVLPSADITLVFTSMFLVHLNVYINGVKYGLLSYIVISVLCAMLLMSRPLVVLMFVLFGHYAIEKHYIDKLGRAYMRWILKYLLFNALFAVMYLIAKAFLTVDVFAYVIFAMMQILIIVYDRALDVVTPEVVRRTGIKNAK